MKNEIFEPCFITATTLNDAYFQLLYQVYYKGKQIPVDEGSYKGDIRYQFPLACGFIQQPHVRPLAPIMPEGGNIAPTTTDEKLDEYFAHYLMDDQLEKGEHYRYSCWLNSTVHYSEFETIPRGGYKPNVYEYNTFTTNNETPIEWVIRTFVEKGFGNNHCYINIGNVDSGFNYDVPYENETDRKTSPCFRGIDFKIIDGIMFCNIVFRSWDLYAGFPENMGGFTLLQEYVCDQINQKMNEIVTDQSSHPFVVPGPLAFSSTGLHIYGFQVKPVLELMHKEKWSDEN